MAETNTDWKEKASQYAKMAVQNSDRMDFLEAEVEWLRAAIRLDIEDAQVTCGGDGMGCKAFRPYYGDDQERRYRKCGQCPMEALSNVREAMSDPAQPKEG